MANVREATNRILEYMEEGMLDPDTVIKCCLAYMSEDEVADMARINDLFPEEESDEA